jgi:hypothetical protein
VQRLSRSVKRNAAPIPDVCVVYGCRRDASATQIATAIAAANSNFGALGSVNSDMTPITARKLAPVTVSNTIIIVAI